MGWLKSLDDVLFEVMSWLVFWPLTFCRAVRHPLVMMRYADTELNDAPEGQYQSALSPPLFLFIAILGAHAFEVLMVGNNPVLNQKNGLATFIGNDTNLLALRMALFALFPLLAAFRALRSTRQAMTRDTLRVPFYAQCYVATPLALALSVATTLSRTVVPLLQIMAAVLIIVGAAWFVSVETAWFRRVHKQSLWRAFGNATRVYFEAMIAVYLIGAAFA